MRRLIIALCLPFLLGACGADNVWAPEEEVTRALHSTGDRPSITLYTAIRILSGEGAHSGLMIDSGHRVIFDPAGTWYNRNAPERHDVHFGITDKLLEFYIDYHARETFYVVEQKIYVTPEVAAAAMKAVQSYGSVPKAMCSNSITTILRQVPGFESIPHSFFPGKTMRAFGQLPGVTERKIYDNDADDNKGLLVAQATAP